MRACWEFSIRIPSALHWPKMSLCLIRASQWPVRGCLRNRAFGFSLLCHPWSVCLVDVQVRVSGPVTVPAVARSDEPAKERSTGSWINLLDGWSGKHSSCVGKETRKSERPRTLMREKRWNVISFFKIIYERLQAHATQTCGIQRRGHTESYVPKR